MLIIIVTKMHYNLVHDLNNLYISIAFYHMNVSNYKFVNAFQHQEHESGGTISVGHLLCKKKMFFMTRTDLFSPEQLVTALSPYFFIFCHTVKREAIQ